MPYDPTRQQDIIDAIDMAKQINEAPAVQRDKIAQYYAPPPVEPYEFGTTWDAMTSSDRSDWNEAAKIKEMLRQKYPGLGTSMIGGNVGMIGDIAPEMSEEDRQLLAAAKAQTLGSGMRVALGTIASIPSEVLPFLGSKESRYALARDLGAMLEVAGINSPMGQGYLGAAMPAGAGESLTARTVQLTLPEVKSADISSKIVPEVTSGIHAYHASPYDFDKFSLDNLGKGFGANRFGRGIYASEDPLVSGLGGEYWRGFVQDMKSQPERTALYMLQDAKFDKDLAIMELLQRRAKEIERANDPNIASPYEFGGSLEQSLAGYDKIIEVLSRKGELPGPKVYELNINANPEHMLNWDTPIRSQNPLIQEIAREKAGKLGLLTANDMPSYIANANEVSELLGLPKNYENAPRIVEDITGRELHRGLQKYYGAGNNEAQAQGYVADELREAGIPGIRYLGNSGKGMSDFVTFDPSIIDIVKKYADGGEVDDGLPFDMNNGGTANRYANGGPVNDADIEGALHIARQHFGDGGFSSITEEEAGRELLRTDPEYAAQIYAKNGMKPPEPQYGPNILQRGYNFIMGNTPDRQPLPAMDVPAFQRPVYNTPVAVPTARGAIYQSPSQADAARRTTDFLANRTAIGQLVQGAYQSAKDAFTAPGRAMKGEIQPDQMIPEALNFAGFVTGGSGVVPVEANSLRAGAGLFSKAERAAADLPMEKMQGPQALGMLTKAGVSPEELKWTGLADRLAATPQLTKQDLLRMIREGDVQLGETTFKASGNAIRQNSDQWQQAINEAERRGDWNEVDRLTRAWEESEGVGGEGTPKYQSYSIPGGQNYQETLVTLDTDKPFRDYTDKLFNDYVAYTAKNFTDEGVPSERAIELATKFAKAMAEKVDWATMARALGKEDEYMNVFNKPSVKFQSGHWRDNKNVIAHIRTNQFDGFENGKYFTPASEKVFNLDELQSDWAQKGRGEGFSDPDLIAKAKTEYRVADRAWMEAKQKVQDYQREFPFDAGFSPKNPQELDAWHQQKNNALDRDPEFQRLMKDFHKAIDARNDAKATLQEAEAGVAVAPYVQSTNQWTDLGLKKAVSQALDSGSDVFTWVPGSVAAERFDLSKEIAEVRYDHLNNDLYAYDHGGREVINQYTEPQQLDEYIGKELAEKVRNEIKDKQSIFDEYEVGKDEETGMWYPHLYGEQLHEYGGTPVEFRSKYDAEQYIKDMIENDPDYANVSLSGLDLKVGGEGMKDFYNNIVPKRLSEIIRKATGEKPVFKTWTIQTGEGPMEVQGFRITPTMREKLMAAKEKSGGYFPHFAYGGKVEDSHSVNKALQIAAEASV